MEVQNYFVGYVSYLTAVPRCNVPLSINILSGKHRGETFDAIRKDNGKVYVDGERVAMYNYGWKYKN